MDVETLVTLGIGLVAAGYIGILTRRSAKRLLKTAREGAGACGGCSGCGKPGSPAESEESCNDERKRLVVLS